MGILDGQLAEKFDSFSSVINSFFSHPDFLQDPRTAVKRGGESIEICFLVIRHELLNDTMADFRQQKRLFVVSKIRKGRSYLASSMEEDDRYNIGFGVLQRAQKGNNLDNSIVSFMTVSLLVENIGAFNSEVLWWGSLVGL